MDFIRKIKNNLSILLNYSERNTLFPAGHFYSPLPSLQEVERNSEKIFSKDKNIFAIELNEKEQLDLLYVLSDFYNDQPFSEGQSDHRYHFVNDFYSYSDGLLLYSMMRHLKPKKIIEVGSGYSTCAMIDTNELFLGNSTVIECIEPYPELLKSLLRPRDESLLDIKEIRLQDVGLDNFKKLNANDILFIDSTHVSKIDSDVNYIIHEILPSLGSGVFIHVHDIIYPFEYPREWIFEGKAWNEAYLLRAFLEYNSTFKIVMFNSFLAYKHPELLQKLMPLCMKNPGGSIWLKKI